MEKQSKKEYLIAANMINPNGHTLPDSDHTHVDLDANQVITIFKKNKVPLATFDTEQLNSYPDFFNTSQYRAAHECEQALFTSLRNEWDIVRQAFLKEGIESILIKSAGFFPYKSDNLDVLIKQSKREQAQTILKCLGYIELKNVEEPYKTLFRRFAGGKSVSAIHLHNKVAWINPFHDEELLWDRYHRSSFDEIVDIPSPEDSILILTAHWFYEDKEIKLSDIMKIAACLKQDNLDWHYMRTLANRMGWLNGFYYALLIHSFVEKHLYGETTIQENRLENMKSELPDSMRTYLENIIYPRKISLPFKISKVRGKFLHLVKTLKDQSTSPKRKVYELYLVTSAAFFQGLRSQLKINLRFQPRMLITLSGVDGSGKSTYADVLSDIFTFCEFRTRFVWSRVGSSDFLKPFSKTAKLLLRLRRDKNSPGNPLNETATELRGKDYIKESMILRVTGLTLLLVEMLWLYFFKVTLPLLTKKVVICDRYIYDTLADIEGEYGTSPNSTSSRLFTKILTTLTPKPDISYLLKVSIEDACKRKEKENINKEWIVKQIDAYEKLASEFKFKEIHTSEGTPITAISDRIINEVLTAFYRRWHT